MVTSLCQVLNNLKGRGFKQWRHFLYNCDVTVVYILIGFLPIDEQDTLISVVSLPYDLLCHFFKFVTMGVVMNAVHKLTIICLF